MVRKVMIPIKDLLIQYSELRERAKNVKKRMDEIAKQVKEYATLHGTKDKNGGFYSETEDFIYGAQAKNSVKLNKEKAKEFFLAKGLYAEIIDVVEVINEDKIEKLFADKKITLADIESLMDTTTSFSIDVKEKVVEATPQEVEEAMPTIETKKMFKKKK